MSRAAVGGVPAPEGSYIVDGTNPNGSRYRGSVSIARHGGQYQLDWRVGQSSYRGLGTLDANVLTVNWGGATPVVYSLGQDGVLRGLWHGGLAAENLTPSR